LAEAGHRRATTLFTWRRAAERCADVYRQAIERQAAATGGAARLAC
jgi:hypothetical protein